MFIFISAFILKQICRCLFKSVCSDPCSTFLPVCLLQIPECSWKRRQSESFTQHRYLGALEPELPCTHSPTGKKALPTRCCFSGCLRWSGWILEGLRRRTCSRWVGPASRDPSFSCWLISAPWVFVFPAWCPVSKQSLFPWRSLAALSPRWAAEQEG